MGREWLLSMFMVLLAGAAGQALAWCSRLEGLHERAAAHERACGQRRLRPVVPVLIIAAWLFGWTLTQPDPVSDRRVSWAAYGAWAPFALVLGRAGRALLCSPAAFGIAMVRAARARENAHARHRDPLRIWLAPARLIRDSQALRAQVSCPPMPLEQASPHSTRRAPATLPLAASWAAVHLGMLDAERLIPPFPALTA
ncbi:MAG: hypothetical protein M0T84_01320 [Betaproteobacteria bacterium]|nr:hypothetical protein [Betaproteobacteria bacterium]